MMKRGVRFVLTVAVMMLVNSSVQALENVKISYQRSSTLWQILKENGTLDEKLAPLGFKVRWHEFNSSLLSSLNSGALDLHADVADAFAVFTQAADAPLVYYATERNSPKAEAVIVPAGSPIQTIEDLRGKKVAVSRGSGSHYLLIAALRSAGMTLQDIQPVYLEASEGAAAFSTGAVDAWSTWDPFLSVEEYKNQARVIADGEGLLSYNRFYMATDRFAREHPEVIQATFEALVEAGHWVKANPEEAAARLSPLWGNIEPAAIAMALKRRTLVPEPMEASLLAEQQRIIDAYFEEKLIPRRVNSEDIAILPVR